MMNKVIWKRILAFVLAGIMVLGTAGCGKKGGDNPNGELAKQAVFSWEELPIPIDSSSYSVSYVNYLNDRIYVIVDAYYYKEGADDGDGEDGIDEDGITEDGITEDGAEAPEEGVAVPLSALSSSMAVPVPEVGYKDEDYSVPVEVWELISFNKDGSDVKSVELSREEVEGKDYGWFNYMTIGPDGCVYAVEDYYVTDSSDPENSVSTEHLDLICWSGEDGSQKWSHSLKEGISEDEYTYMNTMAVLEDGSVVVVMDGSICRLLVFGPDGQPGKTKEVDSTLFTNMNMCLVNPDGTLLLTTWNDDWTKLQYCTYDLNTGVASEKKELPGNVTSYSMYSDANGGIYLTNGNGIYTYDIETGAIEQFMSFINSDFPSSWMNNICFIDNEHFMASYNNEDYQTVVGMFTRVDPKDIPDKITLVLGCNYLNSEFRSRVVDFNKTNEKYRIMIKDYSQYATNDDYMAGYTQLNNDILAGNMPDILVPTGDIPIDNYIQKGLLADIGKLIEEDEELSKKEFMQNVFDAYSTNGTLYYVVPYFTISTMVGKKSLVGDRMGWNMEEFNEVMAGLPEGTSAFGDMTRDSYLRSLMSYAGSEYVNLETGTCSFDSPDFISALEYAKTLPESIEYDYDNYDWTYYENQYRENRTLLMSMYLYDLRSIKRTAFAQFGEDISFVGFPTENKNGSYIEGNYQLVLSAKSVDLEGAWEFARYYLLDEYQQRMADETWGFPVNKEIMMQMAEKAKERPYWEDEEGNREYYDDTYYIDGEEVVIPPMTQEEVDKALEFIGSVNRTYYYDEEIQNIINEEVGPFFEGQKSAKEVADIIQSRAMVYVNER